MSRILLRIKSRAQEHIHTLYRRLAGYRTAFGKWLYDRNFTPRRIKHVARKYSFLFVPVLVLLFLYFLVSNYQLDLSGLSVIPQFAMFIVQVLIWLGGQLGLQSDFATTVVGDLIAFLAGTVIAWIFAPKSKKIAPDIAFFALSPREQEDGVQSYAIHVSNEEGETAALACQARIIFEDIGKKDVIDMPETRFTSSNFTQPIKADLLWDDGKKERTLRSGDDTEIEVLRLIPARHGIEAHFAIPSANNSWRSTICLRAKTTFYPKIRIIPLNAKHTTQKYELKFDSSVGNWVLDFIPPLR